MSKKLMFVLVAIVLMGILGCARTAQPQPGTAPAPKAEVQPVAKTGWEADWDKTVEAAKKEKRVSIYITLFGPNIRTISKTFTDKYGVEVEVLPGRGEELTAKILAERRAGLDINDVVITGFNTIFGLKKLGITQPLEPSLILPEVVDPKGWYTNPQLPFGDKERHLFYFIASPNRDIIVNADVTNPNDIKTWQDLLDPKWKGKIIWADPTMAGSGFNGVSTLVYNKKLDWDFYRQMVSRQQITLSRNHRQIVEWIAQKKFLVSISAESTPVAEFIKDGINLVRVPVKEGTYVSAAAGVLFINNRAPRHNAAKLFVNWLLSREGQTLFAQESLRESSRDDVPKDHLDPLNRRQPGEAYFPAANSIEEWIYQDQENYQNTVRDIFSPLLR